MAKIIVGLGNPEIRYELTKHNVGWLALDSLENEFSLSWREKFKGEFADINVNGEKFIILKPKTYMNLSGESVVPAATFYKVSPEDILVIHDELDLPFGTLGLKKGGGLAGHNGLKSIAGLLGSQDFLRLRIGIGRPKNGSVSSWVLSNFSSEQEPLLGDLMAEVQKAIVVYINSGFEKAARTYSKKKIFE
jgi:PTH1 family peptidyl-tRNA hydrolase